MTENWKNIIAGGDSSFSAYCEAIIEGMVDPNIISHSRFKHHVEGKYFVDPNIFSERITSQLNVANLMKNTRHKPG